MSTSPGACGRVGIRTTGPRLPTAAVLWLAPALLLAACGPDADDASRASVRDSAGIRILEYGDAAEGDAGAEAWTPRRPPLLEVGAVEGEGPAVFDGIRDAVRRSDGGVVVADGGSRELRYFDASGRHLRSVGGEGGGPGEYRAVSALAVLPADSVAVWDARARRLSVLSPEGDFVGAVRPPELETGLEVGFHGFFDDGSFVLSVPSFSLEESASEGGVQRPPLTFARIGRAGELLDTLATLPGGEVLVRSSEGAVELGRLLFGRETFAAVGADRLRAGDSEVYEIREYDARGALVGLVRRPYEPDPVTEEHLWAAWEERLRSYPSGLRERVETDLRESGVGGTPHSEALPAFSGLRATAEGAVWVRESVVPGRPERWRRFGPEGGRTTLELPPRFRALAFGPGYVVGVARDELDTERVQVLEVGPVG